ncbi:AbfB domain-containing protein [Bradyrhizobium erythrophlei]|uniref:AbfB domain-containing protein n=1 Tax=Bradyrhizobium erythrophlei TaxID=1437360 RepID=UPI0035EAF2D5
MDPKLVKPTFLSLLLVASLLIPQYAWAAEKSFKSLNFPDRFIRHRNFLMFVEPATNALSINDSAFRVVSGLAGSCHSFESRNFPGFFIRHQNFRLKLNKFEDQDLFRNDATFCIRPGLANASARSFESINFPGHFMRHQDFELRIQPNDGSELFKKDATFFEENAGVPFGDDNVAIPAPRE